MYARIRRNFRPFVLLAIVSTGTANMTSTAVAQLDDGAIIVPEFFEELYQIGSGGGATDLLNSPTFDKVPGNHLAIADASTAYVSYFSDLYRFNFTTGQLTYIDELSFTPSEITIDDQGSLVAVAPGELFRLDPVTGAETSIYDEAFFGPQDAVVDGAGNIYLTEFFDGLGALSPAGVFSQIGNFATNMFTHVDLGPDGNLYLSTTTGASFYRVDPTTGSGVELDSEVFTFIDDLQIDGAGDIVFAGEVNAKQGVFRFNPDTTELTTIVDDSSVNGGFFNPNDIAIFSLSSQEFADADFNHDGDVDGGDLAHLLSSYGQSAAGDINGDGNTDGADVLAWQRQFTGTGGLAASVVPEPSCALLLTLSATCCQFRRQRRS